MKVPLILSQTFWRISPPLGGFPVGIPWKKLFFWVFRCFLAQNGPRGGDIFPKVYDKMSGTFMLDFTFYVQKSLGKSKKRTF